MKNNVQLVHKDLNRMKNHFGEKFFYNVCKAVTNYRKQDFNPRVIIWDVDPICDREFPVMIDKDEVESYNSEHNFILSS